MVQIPLINLKQIAFSYPGQPPIFKDLELLLGPGERIGLSAPNGSGKTTLFHLIMGLLQPTSGTIEIFGKHIVTGDDFFTVRRKIGLLFQDADDQLFSPTVIEDVAFGPLNLGHSPEAAREISLRTLKFLGLEKLADRVTFKLSGGEKKLVSLATVLAMEPEVLLLDEPTSGLDRDTKSRLIDILNDLALPSIIISHEFDFLSSTVEHIYTMDGGRILFDEELHIHHHEHAHRLGKQPHKHI
ncbi:MAG: ABC transporter ATP-binding protein [Deltaproteobacteria bacterium]|nr:ABC transporter ATP-binding protein [Candidatus Anaeroferrophillus wilburensis]MBN2888263.1 ABC transporter ATP-binding protein [Deltaproteobacteria bacterium]